MKKIPFPQANSLERIYDIFMSLKNDGVSKYEMRKLQGLAEREGAYYLDALYFLGFVDKFNTKFFLSDIGNTLKEKCLIEEKNAFARKILEIDFFKEVYCERNSFEDEIKFRAYVAQKISNNYGIGINTANRRTSSVIAWLEWIDKNIKDK